MAYCAIYNQETKEAEFIEQWDAKHTKGIMTDWTGTIEEFFKERCRQLLVDCDARGYAKWKLYASETVPFSWDAVTPKVSESAETT